MEAMAGLDSDGGSTRSSSLGEEGASMRTSPSPGSTPCSTPSPTPDPGATVARHRERSSELEASSALMELFAVQLQVTCRLLEAEHRKLNVLQRELGQQLAHSESMKDRQRKKVEQLRNNMGRIQQQHDQLECEYQDAALGLLRKSTKLRKSSRSQPAIGLKQTAKNRPTIFGTVAKDTPPDCDKRRSFAAPQMYSLRQMIMASSSSTAQHNGLPTNIDESQALVYQDGHLVSGPLDALVQHLVPTNSYCPDKTYIFAFLLSSRLYLKPHLLLNQVCETCLYQQNLALDCKEKTGKFGHHMIQLLGEWTDNFAYDFRDERMMKTLQEITKTVVSVYPELNKEARIMMHNLVSKLSHLQKYEDLLSRISAEAAQRLLNIMPTTDIYEMCDSPLTLAQQLTHIELERLSMIDPEEFVQAFALEKNNKDTKFKDLKQTNNLESYVHWFNRLSYFIATEICMHLKKKNRVRMIEYFIDVAKECINIGNFNSLMAIIAGLNMNPIQRLKKTWAKVNKDKFEILEHQMNPSSNFGSYRSSLKAVLWRSQGAMEDREKIVIPFFSLFVKDMYFLNEGCAGKLETGHINFEKFWKLANQISEFMTWKQVECPFDRHPPVLNYVLTNPVFSENSLALASFECEGPDNSYEKERYKTLKQQAGL